MPRSARDATGKPSAKKLHLATHSHVEPSRVYLYLASVVSTWALRGLGFASFSLGREASALRSGFPFSLCFAIRERVPKPRTRDGASPGLRAARLFGLRGPGARDSLVWLRVGSVSVSAAFSLFAPEEPQRDSCPTTLGHPSRPVRVCDAMHLQRAGLDKKSRLRSLARLQCTVCKLVSWLRGYLLQIAARGLLDCMPLDIKACTSGSHLVVFTRRKSKAVFAFHSFHYKAMAHNRISRTCRALASRSRRLAFASVWICIRSGP